MFEQIPPDSEGAMYEAWRARPYPPSYGDTDVVQENGLHVLRCSDHGVHSLYFGELQDGIPSSVDERLELAKKIDEILGDTRHFQIRCIQLLER